MMMLYFHLAYFNVLSEVVLHFTQYFNTLIYIDIVLTLSISANTNKLHSINNVSVNARMLIQFGNKREKGIKQSMKKKNNQDWGGHNESTDQIEGQSDLRSATNTHNPQQTNGRKDKATQHWPSH